MVDVLCLVCGVECSGFNMFGNGILLVWQTLFRLGINFVSLSVRLMFRPRIAFDSFLILCEIGALQFCFYAGIILCCLFVDFICGIPFSDQQLLNPAVFSLHTLPGRAAFFGQIGGGLVSALLFTFLETYLGCFFTILQSFNAFRKMCEGLLFAVLGVFAVLRFLLAFLFFILYSKICCKLSFCA